MASYITEASKKYRMEFLQNRNISHGNRPEFPDARTHKYSYQILKKETNYTVE